MISKIKKYIKLGKKEIDEITTAIERAASIINKDQSKYFSTLNLDEVNQNITILYSLENEIKKMCPNDVEDGTSLLYTLISIKKEEKIHHIFSLNIEENQVNGFYINVRFLDEELKINNIFINNLKNTKKIYEALEILFELFLSKLDQYNVNKFLNKGFNSLNLFSKISIIRDMISFIYNESEIYELNNGFYLFKTTDIKLKASIDKERKITLGLYNFYKSKINKVNKITMGTSVVNFDEKLESESQSNAINELNSKYVNVIGQPGSGKTYLASLIAKRYVELSALSKEPINTLYTTYSKYSLAQFKIYIKEFEGLIFEDTEECIKHKINELEEQIDQDRYKRIENSIKEYKIDTIENRYKIDANRIDSFNKVYNFSLDENDKNQVIRLTKYLEEHYVAPSLFTQIWLGLGFIKEKNFYIPNSLTIPLKNNGIKINDSVKEYKMLELSERLKLHVLHNENKVKKYIEKNNFADIKDKPTKFNGLNLDISDLVYFLTYKPLIKNINKKNIYINELKKVLNKEKYDANILKEIFPIWTGLVTEINNFNMIFNQILVDESVLVPGYFFPLIMNKSEYIIAFGDINQLSLNQSFFPNMEEIIKKIYKDNINLNLSSKSDLSQESFFGHMKYLTSNENILVLTDNYRNNLEIFNLTKEIGGNEYDIFFQKYISKHNLNCTVKELTNHYITNNEILNYDNEKIETPFVFINNDDNKLNKIVKLLKENNLSKDDLMIVVPFKKDIQTLVNIFGENILIDTIENIQGIEKKIVVFYWDVELVSNSAFKYLDKTRFNLMITRAKDLFITIGNEEFLFETNIDNESNSNGFIVVNKFLRNPNFYIKHIC